MIGRTRNFLFWFFILAVTQGGGLSGFAAVQHSFPWLETSAEEVPQTESDSSQNISAETLFDVEIPNRFIARALNDRDKRISTDFHIPPGLRKSVTFWLRVYTQYTSYHAIFLDNRDPSIVYEVVDLRSLSKKSRNHTVYELMRERLIKKKLHAYRRAFVRLSHPETQRNRYSGEEEKNITNALRSLRRKPKYNLLSAQLVVQSGQRDNIVKGLRRADDFFPRMEMIFDSAGLPVELTKLTLLESSFNERAVSRAGAAGVWQFMPNTGDAYMLIDGMHGIDERMSPLKSTVAAAKLLKQHHRVFKSWPMTVTSYNYGFKTLLRIPENDRGFQKVGHTLNRKSQQYGIGWAGRNYYSGFLAVLYAITYRELFYGPQKISAFSQKIAFKELKTSENLRSLSKKSGVSIALLEKINPDIKDPGQTLPRGFIVALPSLSDDLSRLIRDT